MNSSNQKLNDDQQVVLEWLKNNFHSYGTDASIFETISDMTKHHRIFFRIGQAYVSLNLTEEIQVIQAFLTWALKFGADLEESQ